MAYAAAVYLRQLVEQELIHFICRSLECEESKVRGFHSKVSQVLDKLQAPASSFLVEIQDYFDDLNPKTLGVDQSDDSASLFNKVRLNDRSILNRMQYVMDQLDEVNSMLHNFLEYHDLVRSLTCHASEILALLSFWEFVNGLISLTHEFQEVVSLLNAMAEEAIFLHDILANLLLKLKDTNDDSAVNQIKVILGFVGDKIEDLLSNYHFPRWNIDIEALMAVRHSIGDLRESIDGFMSGIRCGSSQRSHYQRPQQWFHKWQNLFCIRPKCDEDNAQLNSFPDTKQLQIRGSEVEKGEASSKSAYEREEIVIGLDDDITKIVDELTRPPSRLLIVTIAGMGGIGKTTLARKVYNHTRIVHHFHCTAWISGISIIGQALSHLLRSICEERSDFFSDETHGQTTEDKGQSLWRILRKKKYLIVVDDLWGSDWNGIERYLPDDNVGSRILITSRSMKFPTYLPQNPPHFLRLLKEYQSWEMLEAMVFGKQSCPLELVDIGKAIARKCRGLRLIIVVIAGTLLSIPRSFGFWSSLLNSMESAVYVNPESCLDILALSYSYLPHHLKACILLMGSFPASAEIDAEKLFNLWIAEGFLDLTSSLPAEKVAEENLEDLISRCLILVGRRGFDGTIKTCYMHELLRQLCLQKAYEEGFKPRHLISESKIAADFNLHLKSHLRSVILLTPYSDVSLDELVLHLSGCTMLRVLDMYFLPWDFFPTKILDLVNLRYLALNVTYIVDAGISEFLWKLQTLVVYGPWIPRVDQKSGYIPSLFLDCWKMPWLRNVSVRVPCCFRYSTLPQTLEDGSSVTSDLQTLSTITFSSCTAEVLSLMPGLNKLGIFETEEDLKIEEFRRCFENLQSMTELEILKCFFFKGRNSTPGYELPARNRVLDLLPLNLKKLTLCGSWLSWDRFELLSSLNKLETLKLKDYAFRGREWELNEEVFGCLKQLLIDETDLESWVDEGADNFPCLEHLELRSCRSLTKIPILAFSALEHICLHNCSQSAEDSAKEFEKQYGNLQVILKKKRTADERGGKPIPPEYMMNNLDTENFPYGPFPPPRQ